MTVPRVHAVVLAAGKGTRMKSELAKVLHEAAGMPLVGWVMAALTKLDLADVCVVVGYQADEVRALLPEGVTTALQSDQHGTGHATQVALESLELSEGLGEGDVILVVLGDMPLLLPETLEAVIARHTEAAAHATILTTELGDPTGYGRIVRDGARVTAIVEDRDANDEQRSICEVNTSIYAFDAAALREALERVVRHNAQGEMYLTDVVAIMVEDGKDVVTLSGDAVEVMGVNSHDQLAEAAGELRRRINRRWMRDGVWMADPDRTYIEPSVTLAPGARIHPDVHLVGATVVDAGAEVGPSVYAEDSAIGPDSKVWYAVLRGASIGPGAQVGPYASLRPGAELLDESKAGTFVEVKASTIGHGSKVPHLSYIGDATIGEGSNIGAGTITVNYDGFAKHRTKIGARVKIGSDTMLVAPVEVGDDAYTGAGSVITEDVAPGALAVERSPQIEITGYAARREQRAREERD
jgi:bifunctional UDP-N-acetylglucosamine pyrophosphorylase/glucosamine-1-phosphate N-acetyltransferase